ncbi:uncharacterized protein RSE6_13629 [Rhynchosporium secalis]|uniref:Uncharacterized protein n=1 Tax=Rhynchosporium secalis TaxID=38038 RepID=A0A1E1MTB1_RHYSE|nr:uncharacterized protein RSE6_13629 [Rhynchosporium secalis]
MHFKFLALAAAASTVSAQNQSFCDKYTTTLFTDNTQANQYKLLVAVVNTALIGNYSERNNGIVVNGILARGEVGLAVPGMLEPGQVYRKGVNLLPYFNGDLAGTNQGEGHGVSVNFLDDGGVEALKAGKPSNGKTSRQYLLLTHLYEYFGEILGCSKQGGGDFPKYAGKSSMYSVHKYMYLSRHEVQYFIEQVAASALSFGVAAEDIAPVGQQLMKLFNYRCLPPTTVIQSQGAQLQSICTQMFCPLVEPLLESTACAGLENITHPVMAATFPCKNATYSNSTHPGKLSSCTPVQCPCGCNRSICPGGYNDGVSDESGHGEVGGEDGAGYVEGAGEYGYGNNGGSGSGSGSGESGSGSGSSEGSIGTGVTGSDSVSIESGSGEGSGSGSDEGNGDYNPATVSTAGAAALGMSFIAVIGGGVAFFLL